MCIYINIYIFINEVGEEDDRGVIPSDLDGYSDIKVMFDGTSRVLCNFSIKLSSEEEGGRIHLKKNKEGDDIDNALWADDHLISGPRNVNAPPETGDDLFASVVMKSFSYLDQEESVLLGDKAIRPQVYVMMITRLIR
jgi:hypothetical protein